MAITFGSYRPAGDDDLKRIPTGMSNSAVYTFAEGEQLTKIDPVLYCRSWESDDKSARNRNGLAFGYKVNTDKQKDVFVTWKAFIDQEAFYDNNGSEVKLAIDSLFRASSNCQDNLASLVELLKNKKNRIVFKKDTSKILLPGQLRKTVVAVGAFVMSIQFFSAKGSRVTRPAPFFFC